MLTGLLVPVAFRNKCERATGPKPEPFQSIFPGVNATRTSGTGLERDRNANRNRCEQGHRLYLLTRAFNDLRIDSVSIGRAYMVRIWELFK